VSTLKAGTILNSRYKIQRLLGEGATGAVYLCHDSRDRGQLWAVKELWAEADEDAAFFFRNEADLLRRLRHPAIPLLVDFFEEHGRLYLVMERIEGPTLEAVQREAGGPLLQDEVVAWGLQLCDVLAYLHAQDPLVVYRDLKPANCMLTRSGQIKLVDLGIARLVRPGRPRDTQIFGTPGYCPPEQYHGQSSPVSDIYALGVTLYVLAAGIDDPEKFRFQFPPLRTLNRHVTAQLEAVLGKAVAQAAGERFASMADMRAALEGLRSQGRSVVRSWLARLRHG
jgi:serine/threonine-protein kinase